MSMNNTNQIKNPIVGVLLLLSIYSCSFVSAQAHIDLCPIPDVLSYTNVLSEEEIPIAQMANDIVHALEARDLETVAKFVHPDKGVRFSPYAFIWKNWEDLDLVFSAEKLKTAFEEEVAFDDRTVYNWGEYDGTGKPIELTFYDYFYDFVYDAFYTCPHNIGYNEFVGHVLTINNIPKMYPDAFFVQFYFNGIDPKTGGFDWRSLSLVFEQKGEDWYLVSIVHDQWTT